MYPRAIKAILLHTGQPTAKYARSAPALPIFNCFGFWSEIPFFTYVADSKPVSIDEITITGTDQLVVAISRLKIGFSITAVVEDINKYVKSPAPVATNQRFALHVRSEVKQLGIEITSSQTFC